MSDDVPPAEPGAPAAATAPAAEISPAPENPPQEPIMEIHKPHPVHSWRAFLKEYAIVVLGVATALAAEQA